MTLLLAILATITPHASPPTLVLAPAVVQDQLIWDMGATNWYELGWSNRLYYWTLGGPTNTFEVGRTNRCIVQRPMNVRYFYNVTTLCNGLESPPTNTIKNPPDIVDTVIAQRDGQDIGYVAGWTNTPHTAAAQYRLRIERTNRYEP